MFIPENGWGPSGKRAAVSVTFDNLGDVAQRRIGLKPTVAADGTHLSIEVLPRLLRMLEGAPITYFVEGYNTVAHPDVIRSLRDAGHEIAAHGWEHENWDQTPVPDRRQALTRAVNAFRDMGVDVQGFRPPGGAVALDDLRDECQSNGLFYASPLGAVGDDVEIDGFVSLPFAWKHVDAYVVHEELGALRQKYGDPAAAYSTAEWRGFVEGDIARAKEEGGHVTLIFHPFLLAQDEAYLDLLESTVRSVSDDPEIWAPTCGELAEWVRDTAGQGG
ncbi:hypothetical protein ATO6_20570 [Oceanicola sp. 22II-s10i]|uniref:polysaccharide deacetylase family protein n=1 Tax=Oceanicola sp. 22II-s10i TaxID=1317116 RepID=UPI000B52388A|nr:polysaccharide deacetylase family protein [Oceanicola sp. 22II-s10i]OWU83028.1 hypothetical protein ATO6_20570 [Oceanicola sp. 22II-s10i]